MRLDEIDQPNKKVVFTFGRLNPPHYGHGGLIKTLQLVAKQKAAHWYLFVSSKNEPEKNPLTYEQKCHWIRILFPEVEGHLVIDPSIKTPLIAATWLYKQGFRSATFVAGEDDMESYSQMIKSGNEHGRKNPEAVRMGKGFYFEPLEFDISARLTSATNSRAAATNNDPEAFARSILGPKITNPQLLKAVAKDMFPMVRKGMQLESINEDADEDYRRAEMMKPENQKPTALSKGIMKYTPMGDVDKIGNAVNKGDYKAAILPAAQLATNLIPGRAAATAASTAIGAARGLTDESEELNKRTPSVRELAKKYMTTPDAVHRVLAQGIKVEFEHTNDIEVATEIAMDHLGEKLDYYVRLAKVEENFADGKGPGKPGDSQRHGIPKKATMAELEKVSHAEGRKGQLARWQLNMRRGKKKANEDGPFAFAGGLGGNADGSNLLDRQVAMYPWDINTPHPKEIDEVADQPYRFISPVSTATAQKSMFQTDSGSTIQVFIQVDTGNGVADIGFFDATDKENPTIGVTGKGDAFRIFATVGSIVKQFVAKRKPPYISFSGKSSDAGRIKLYDMIAKNIGRYLPEYKLIDSGFANGDKGYTFKRMAQESVSEVAKVKLSSDPNNFGAWVNDSGKPEKTIMIPINKLSGFEPDSKFDDPTHAKNLANIVKAIKAGKELPPILVRRHGVDRFQVLDGHHRFKAYRMAGMKSIPARLVDPKNVSEEKKPKKPKTIIDGALKTLIAKGRSEDEAIADLKKEIDGKFYDLTETREGALNWLKSYLPNWPDYVLRDWLYRGLTKHDPGENPKEVVDRSLAGEGMSAQTQWKLIPNFEFKIEKLHPDTQRRINIRAGGSANPMKVPKDAERHATQAALAQQQGGVRKEPVIGKMTLQGFELIEGWHRTIQHFKQFPDGYSGPAWVAMNAVSESLRETTDYSRGEELEGIDIMGAPVFITHHAIERLDRKGDRSVDVEEIYEIIEKAVRQHGRDIASLHNTDFALKGENGPPREPKNGFGIALAKTEDSTGNPVYVIKTLHPKLLIGKMPGFKVQGLKRRYSMYEEVEETIKPRVYLDMDGVLADFFGEWSRLAGVNHYKDINNPEQSLQLVRDHPTFWIDLPLLPHAKALIQTVVKNYGEYRICSKPLEGDTRSEPGKLQWIKKHLSGMPPVEVILTADKARFAKNDGYPNILVDDYGVNINSWKAAGGIGIKYEDQLFDHAAKVLQFLARSGVSK